MSAQRPIRCSVIRGGTSKGLFIRAEDLPSEVTTRDRVLLAAMGSPDVREIDGMGGGHPLTSKVAVVQRSRRSGADVDYLFLQVWPDRAEVSDSQNCGNLLAGVGPFAIEENLIEADGDETSVRIWMENTETMAVARVQTPSGRVRYDGDARIDGVPGTAAPIPLEFLDVAGSTCGSLLPTGHVTDHVAGLEVTCIDNGMPVVCVRADDVGLTGREEPAEIEANASVCELVESIRLAAGALMNLGDVAAKTVPKVSVLAPGANGGALSTRTFIPRRVHEAIGVFGAVSVATACLLPGSVANGVSKLKASDGEATLDIEHPTGYFSVSLRTRHDGDEVVVTSSALLRTARLLMRGEVFVPGSLWVDR
ncbi:MAG TPA: 4-oxalomesaconate tautomerase [Acidimicrobiales bacterium]|nr:4-oxalomesaconate tautomerase [Acidimicrobiales bacterium]